MIESPAAPTLDWRELAPPQDTHYCDCDYCDQDGELEPIRWPTLVPMTIDGVDYVTDKFIAVRADLAPIPEGYEGPTLAPITKARDGFMAAPVSSESADGKHFRWQTIRAVEAMGWRLRLLVGSDACAVVTVGDEHIGWAMPVKTIDGDHMSDRFSPPYLEPNTRVIPPGSTEEGAR